MEIIKSEVDNVVQVVEVRSKEDSNNSSDVMVRLTPTGKVSHAKTRVYTQRYRKEWEQMPDFKDWLTSVPYQATRAFCKFCQRNLHAHRLSLLKHMCTLKHQRAAVQYTKRQASLHPEAKQNLHEPEYIIERYDDDDDNEEDDVNYDDENYVQDDEGVISENDQEEEEMVEEFEDEVEGPVVKRTRLEKDEGQDTLAKAIANIHPDFLTENDESMQLEMVVECEQENDDESDLPSVQIVNCRSLPKDVFEVKEGSNKNIQNADDEIQKLNTNDKSVTYVPVTESKNATSSTDIPKKMYIVSSDGKYTLVNSNFRKFVVNQTQARALKSDMKNKILTEVPSPSTSSTSQESTNKNIVLLNPTSMTTKSVLVKKPIVSTHVLETSKGIPVCGLQVSLYKLKEGRWTFLHESMTTANGHCNDFSNVNISKNLTTGRYKFHYDVEKYYSVRKTVTIYPFIEIVFDIKDPNASYHVPLLLSPYSYSTYKDSCK